MNNRDVRLSKFQVFQNSQTRAPFDLRRPRCPSMAKDGMSIIPPAPDSVFDCTLLKALKEKSSGQSGLFEKVQDFISVAEPAADLIVSGPFKHYTLHNSGHSKKIIHLAGFLIPPATLDRITVLDCVLIIYAAYLHDLGMSLTSHERDRILASDDFAEQLHSSPAIAEALVVAKRKFSSTADVVEQARLATSIYELHEALLSEYLRPRHGEPHRYAELIDRLTESSDRKDLFLHRGASFRDALIGICASHVLEPGVLMEASSPYQDRYPRQEPFGGLYANQQFCAGILRMADVLDFDRERTPKILFDSLGIADRMIPGSEVTLKEWQKHLSIHSIEINSLEFVVSAQVMHPVIERAIREFCAYIEREVRDTLSVLRRNRPEILEQYYLELPISVRPQVTSVGYVYREMGLALNQSRIFSLLMGERLYSSPVVALRELLQNSIEACMFRHALQPGSEAAFVEISDEIDGHGHYWLKVKDNGTGMDEHILSEYFLTLGNSYSRSSEFARQVKGKVYQGRPLSPISRFGIGLASVFLIADVLHVETRSVTSPRGDFQGRLLRIEGMLSLAFVTLLANSPAGTLIKLRIKEPYSKKIDSFRNLCLHFLRSSVIRPKIPVKVHLGESINLAGSPYMSLKSDALSSLRRDGLELVLIDLSRWTDRISGRVGLFLAIQSDGTLSDRRETHRLKFGPGGIDPKEYLNDYPGNRASVNGFSMSLKGINKAFAGPSAKTALVYDIEISGDEEVEYDISRQRVMGHGRISVIEELTGAVGRALVETGLWDRLIPEVKEALSWRQSRDLSWVGPFSNARVVQDEPLLTSVTNEIKKFIEWPVGMHKEIATRLGISNGLASRCITSLLDSGKITKPSEQL